MAIPVTLSIVLMIADSLLIWAAVSQHRILIWPWLVLYAIEYVVLVALLVYFMVVMPKTYLKVGRYGVLRSVLHFCHSRDSKHFMPFHLFTANIRTSKATADMTSSI